MPTEPAVSVPPADEPLPDLPPGEFQERIRLLNWAEDRIGTDGVDPAVGDYVIATDGRVLGYGPDYDDLYRRVVTEAGLEGQRLVAFRVLPIDL